jgi:hypothetical protein
MTVVLVVLAVLAGAWLLWINHRWERERQRWRAERERLEAYGEHVAAANGHPHTGDILVYPIDHDAA